MKGADALVRTLAASGVEVCFTNPGTSEIHAVAALDQVPSMRAVLCQQENVATGAADGYARMAEKPAWTLLHLGPGLANGLANLHNAKKAGSPLVNVVGDHATYHRDLGAPLAMDLEAAAAPFSDHVLRAETPADLPRLGAEAVRLALTPPGRIVTLTAPSDVCWGDGAEPAPALAPPAPASFDVDAVEAAARALTSGAATALFLTDQGVRGRGLNAAGRIAAVTGARLFARTANKRIERGAGRVYVERLPYPVPIAIEKLAGLQHIVLAGTDEPVGFFAYPEMPSRLAPEGCAFHRIAAPGADITGALEALAEAIGATAAPHLEAVAEYGRPSGALTLDAMAEAIAAAIPENAIVCDESVTSGRNIFALSRGAPPHDWLQTTGGAIGDGLPLATGAALACPDRKVLCLEGDGSALMVPQALWTQAREGLDVTTVNFANRAYRILEGELRDAGYGNASRRVFDTLSLDRPAIEWVPLAQAFGVPAERVKDAEAFTAALARGLASSGPYLIEAVF